MFSKNSCFLFFIIGSNLIICWVCYYMSKLHEEQELCENTVYDLEKEIRNLKASQMNILLPQQELPESGLPQLELSESECPQQELPELVSSKSELSEEESAESVV